MRRRAARPGSLARDTDTAHEMCGTRIHADTRTYIGAYVQSWDGGSLRSLCGAAYCGTGAAPLPPPAAAAAAARRATKRHRYVTRITLAHSASARPRAPPTPVHGTCHSPLAHTSAYTHSSRTHWLHTHTHARDTAFTMFAYTHAHDLAPGPSSRSPPAVQPSWSRRRAASGLVMAAAAAGAAGRHQLYWSAGQSPGAASGVLAALTVCGTAASGPGGGARSGETSAASCWLSSPPSPGGRRLTR